MRALRPLSLSNWAEMLKGPSCATSMSSEVRTISWAPTGMELRRKEFNHNKSKVLRIARVASAHARRELRATQVTQRPLDFYNFLPARERNLAEKTL